MLDAHERNIREDGRDWRRCVDLFVKHRSRVLRPRTVALDVECLGWLERRLEEVGCDLSPAAVRREHIEALIDGMADGTLGRMRLANSKMAGRQLKPVSINKKLQSWRMFFSFLLRRGLITENPMEDVPELAEDEAAIEWLHDDEVSHLLAYTQSEIRRQGTFNVLRDYVAIRVALDTGVRPGELLALEVRDVDMEHRSIRVRSETSKQRSWRDIPVLDAVLVELQKFISERHAQGFVCPQMFCSSLDNVTPSGEVKPMRTATLNRTLSKYARGAEIRKKVTGYVLRHTFARLYLQNGGQLAELRRLLGHRTAAQVLRYSDLWGMDLQHAHARFSPMRDRD